MSVHIVVGGQYGSEGKGAFVQYLANEKRVGWRGVAVVRTGGPNAGHSVLFEGEEHLKMQQVPCGWDNQRAQLLLGPGSLVHMDTLLAEINMVEARIGHELVGRLFIDPNAAIVEDAYHEQEKELVERIGSTGEGVGVAMAARIQRVGKLARDEPRLTPYIADVPGRLHELYAAQVPIIIESTQGFGLSLTRSGEYPYTTSRDLTPAAIMNEAGVPHDWNVTVTAVFRTFPIRVAGPSGPMRGGELTWDALEVQSKGYIKAERTTVTNKIRRVSGWDEYLAYQTCRHVHPDNVYLSFYDYVHPEYATASVLPLIALREARRFQEDLSAPIRWIGTGFGHIIALNAEQRDYVQGMGIDVEGTTE